jgi:hypothetical protein
VEKLLPDQLPLAKDTEAAPIIFRMDLHAIIEDIANRADDFLAERSDRKDAREAIGALIADEYPALAIKDRKKVNDGVMAILEKEDFFGTEFAGDSWKDDSDEAEE